ncbi:MAG: hypothetical protein KA731_02325 [Candidatus Moranbacteria bacterium]|nr:hypothetical protein [Candidatus Moranbacteria bacterium]MBP6034217.1 hypothetical protein [Candidatus Moranbacteria bacterium]
MSILFPLMAFLAIIAALIIGVGLLSGWFHKCSHCGSRLTITGTAEEDRRGKSEVCTIRDCFSCEYQEVIPLPKKHVDIQQQ